MEIKGDKLKILNWDAMSLEQALNVLAKNPAEIFGFNGRKGTIRIGADADLVLFDPNSSWKVRSNKFFTKHLDGMQLWSDFTY